jgi:integrase
MLNEHLDAWREGRDDPADLDRRSNGGSIDWRCKLFFASKEFKRLTPRSQKDYREALTAIADLPTKLVDEATGQPARMGTLQVSSLSHAAVDKIYEKLRRNGEVNRQADYAIDVARRAWKVVRRAHPGLFLIPVTGPDGKTAMLALNPFEQVEREPYERDTAVCTATRAEALALARAAAAEGHPASGVAALICFEWLQRPEDVRRGRITWTDYRPADRPTEVRIFHHKTRATVWMPLEAKETDPATGEATRVLLYPELEAMIAELPRLGVPMIMLEPKRGSKDQSGNRTARPYSEPCSQHIIQKARAKADLPAHVTLEACQHGGMTELGDCGLSEQEIMSLSGHVTPAAARLYIKRTANQRLAAATKRRAAVERTKTGREWESTKK